MTHLIYYISVYYRLGLKEKITDADAAGADVAGANDYWIMIDLNEWDIFPLVIFKEK